MRIDKPEHSKASHKEMLDHVEGLLKKLELPYRILLLCGGDQSFTSAICYDFEVYSEAQKRWLEVSSVSNFDTYQANRLHCRYRNAETRKIELCHTLNGSALALPRIVAAIIENNQTPEGIRVPKVLVPYCGFDMLDDKGIAPEGSHVPSYDEWNQYYQFVGGSKTLGNNGPKYLKLSGMQALFAAAHTIPLQTSATIRQPK